MKNNTRTKNLFLNIIVGYIAQISVMILSFVSRQIFLRFLSADYLGINGLYTNILTILSLAELGLDSAVVFSLYKPVADNNNVLVHSFMKFFRKVYFKIAFSILSIGLCLIPFLKFIVNSDLQDRNLILYYVIFLLKTVATYFVAYKIGLLNAYQEGRIYQLVSLGVNILFQIASIVALTIWKNYFAYIVTSLFTSMLLNFIISIICSRRYKSIFKEKEEVKIEKKPIIERVYSTFLYKIGVVLINSTDNILISILVGTIAVGYYSNYYTVVSSIQSVVGIVTTALLCGIGNLATNADEKKQHTVFDTLLMFYHFVASLGLSGFLLLMNDLISLWLGDLYLFDFSIVIIVGLNFYFNNAISPIWMFRESNGLFNDVRYLILIRAVINIVLSVLLGIVWKTFGILLATLISLLLTSFWFEPMLICRKVFKSNAKLYWIKQIKYCCLSVISLLLSYLIINRIEINTWPYLVLKALLICIINAVTFIVANYKSEEFLILWHILIQKNKEKN